MKDAGATYIFELGTYSPAPKDIFLSSSSVSESPFVSDVGEFTTWDLDTTDGFIYSLAEGDGDEDNGTFAIDGATGSLTKTGIVDFETRDLYSIRVRSEDPDGNFSEKIFPIQITDFRGDDDDNDGLVQAIEEDFYGTSDLNDDFDNDGFSDGQEVINGSDPTDPLSIPTDNGIPKWSEVGKILASDAAEGDTFGFSVAISDTYGLVGAPGDDEGKGAVYIYDAVTRLQVGKLVATDGKAGDGFGNSVAISDNIAVIGASEYSDDLGATIGAAYVYDVATEVLLHKFTVSGSVDGDKFGRSVSISGNYVVVGDDLDNAEGDHRRGSVYVYDLATGDLLHHLIASDGAARDRFGESVSVAGDYIMVGAIWDDDSFSNSGSAYVFDAVTGEELYKLNANEAKNRGYFGSSVSISGNFAVVGAYGQVGNGTSSGSAYVFDIRTGEEIYELNAPDGYSTDTFGRSLSVSGNYVIVGALQNYQESVGGGAAYVYELITGKLIQKITASDVAQGDLYGGFVSVSGNRALVGAIRNDDSGEQSGSAYFLELSDAVPTGYLAAILEVGYSGADVLPSAIHNSVGVQNGIAYSLGIPLNGEDLTQAHKDRLPNIVKAGTADTFGFQFTIPETTPEDVTLCILQSENLGSTTEDWTEIARKVGNGAWTGVATIREETVNGFDEVTIENMKTLSEAPHSFMRLEIQLDQ